VESLNLTVVTSGLVMLFITLTHQPPQHGAAGPAVEVRRWPRPGCSWSCGRTSAGVALQFQTAHALITNRMRAAQRSAAARTAARG